MIRKLAIDLISQYGDDAETIAMMKAAEYAALLDNENWQLWEKVIEMLEQLNNSKSLDSQKSTRIVINSTFSTYNTHMKPNSVKSKIIDKLTSVF